MLDGIKEYLSYNPDTGIFMWIKTKKGVKQINTPITCLSNKDGYIRIGYNRKYYQAHRLAWWFITGLYPPNNLQIDHKDGNKLNNRATNLRLVTPLENQRNKKAHRNGKTNCVYKIAYKHTTSWRARGKLNKKDIHLGNFKTKKEAVEAVKKFDKEHWGV